ncbi:MAG: hypothetical protein AAFP13_13730 [Pseudomonadota bacterium]
MTYTAMDDTAATIHADDLAAWGTTVSGRSADGMGALTRLIQMLFGAGAAVAALSLWIVPGSDLGPDMVALKGALTCGLVIVAFVLWRDGRADGNAVEVDFENREVRLMAEDGETPTVRASYSFSELGAFKVVDGALYIHDRDARLLTVLPLEPDVAASLRG